MLIYNNIFNKSKYKIHNLGTKSNIKLLPVSAVLGFFSSYIFKAIFYDIVV